MRDKKREKGENGKWGIEKTRREAKHSVSSLPSISAKKVKKRFFVFSEPLFGVCFSSPPQKKTPFPML
jgi:hypothetical protein